MSDRLITVDDMTTIATSIASEISTINAQISALSTMSFELVLDDDGNVTIERSDLVDTSEVSY